MKDTVSSVNKYVFVCLTTRRTGNIRVVFPTWVLIFTGLDVILVSCINLSDNQLHCCIYHLKIYLKVELNMKQTDSEMLALAELLLQNMSL